MNLETKDDNAPKVKKTKKVNVREITFDGLMKISDVELVVGFSRVTMWRLEQKGEFPKSVQVSPGRVAKIGSEILEFIKTRPRVGEPETENGEAVTG